MINTNTLALEVRQFAQSSSFTSGDPFSFSIKITDDVSLPGKFDPANYLNAVTSSIEGRVAVVCPGNGGLCVELLRRGAQEVIAFEPRNQFWKSLDAVSKFYNSVHGKTFEIIDKLPVEESGKFNTVIWSEGLDELRDPMKPLTEVLGCLVPRGRLFIELSHGTHKAAPEAINSWRPSPEAFAETIEGIENVAVKLRAEGRNASRTTYTIQNTEDEPILIIPEPESGSEIEARSEPDTSEPKPMTMSEIWRPDPSVADEEDPSETKSTAAFANDVTSDDNKAPEAPVKRRRGRPRKSEKAAPKRRGRKKKD